MFTDASPLNDELSEIWHQCVKESDMIESRNVQVVLYFFLIVIILEGDSRRPRLKEEKQAERRDYRPSKWVANSAMDVWYGNKSMVDILSREFSDVMNRIALRPVRSPAPTEDIKSDVTKLTEHNLLNQSGDEISLGITKHTALIPADQIRNKSYIDDSKLTKYSKLEDVRNEVIEDDTKIGDYETAAEEARTILLHKMNETISKIISDSKK